MANYSYFIPLIVCIYGIQLTSTSGHFNKLFQPENAEILKIMKEELNQFQIDMTKKFMQAHSRRKRANEGQVNDINIDAKGRFEEFAVDAVGPFSTFTFAGRPYVIQNDGIYEVTGLKALSAGEAVSREKALIKRGSWQLQENEKVLNGMEWRHSYFLVTTTGKFSTIYTLHEHSLHPILRQTIKNKANAVDAQLFNYRSNLYMVILNDNERHAVTFSPVFRWAVTYMDEIHQVQTTGASAVKLFEINSKQYIAIAQSMDSTGNGEVGTMVLSMDPMDRLERVQLLWSNGANSLEYIHTEKEHFLVVGQKTEPSIVYWFGGMDFIFWQQFDQLQGENLVMESHQLTSDEPLLLTSNGGSIHLFSRSVSPTKILTTWVKTKTLDLFGGRESIAGTAGGHRSGKIAQLKVLQVDDSGNNDFLAVTRTTPGSHKESLRFYPVKYVHTKPVESQARIEGDKLSNCMSSLKAELENSKDILNRIDQLSESVLTVDGDWDIQGEVVAKKITHPASSTVELAEISPVDARGRGSGGIKVAPSVLLDKIKHDNDRLEMMKMQLEQVVYKSQQSDSEQIVTGDLEFLNAVQFNEMDAAENTDMQYGTINGVSSKNLEQFALKNNLETPQHVTASWTVESITANTFDSLTSDSKLTEKSENFLLKTCSEESQSASGVHQFNEDVKISEVTLQPQALINKIQFTDVVLKDNPTQEIRGFKHAPFVKGTFKENFVNGKNLDDWLVSVAKLSGPGQQFTGDIETGKNVKIVVDNLVVDTVNEKNWNSFTNSVMLNGVPENVEGLFEMEDVIVDHLEVHSISGMSSDALLTTGQDQKITSTFTTENAEMTDSLSAGTVNGVQLSDVVTRNDKLVTINGPVTLENFHVKEIVVPDNVMIANKDVSELAKMTRVHEYVTANNEPIFLQQVNIDRLTTSHINEELVDDFKTKYWSTEGNNVANPAQLVLDNRQVVVQQGSFKTGKINHFKFPNEFVSLHDNDNILLVSNLHFKQPVIAMEDVTMGENAKFAGYDLSESSIVDDKFEGQIRGLKTFEMPLTAPNGAHIAKLNGMDPVNDVVLRSSNEPQIITGAVRFEKKVVADDITAEGGNVQVDGLVDGVNLEEISRTTVYKDRENFIQGDFVFDRSVTVTQFFTSHANNLNVKEVTDNVIFLDRPEQVQTIEGHVTLDHGGVDFLAPSSAVRLNNVPVQEYLSQVVRLDKPPELIKGTKTFKNLALADGLMCTTINGVDLKNLESNAFSKSKSQEITGKWTFKDVNFEENLVSDKIEGISLDNLVFIDEPNTVSSPVEFITDETNIEGPLIVQGNINGIKLNEDVTKGIFIDGAHKFTDITVNGDLIWTKDRPELQQASYFFQNAVQKTGPQIITGNVSFTQGFHSSEIHSPGTWLAGVNLQKIQDDAITTDSTDVVITGLNEFEHPLTIQNLASHVTNLDIVKVNNVDLTALSKDIVQLDDTPNDKVIMGKKRLQGGQVKALKLTVKDKISDVPIQELVTVDHTGDIFNVHFTNINVENNIESESMEGFDLKSLLDDRVSLTKPNQKLQGQYTFLQDVNVKNASGCQLTEVNDVTVKNILTKDNVKHLKQISGKKTFKNLTVEGELETASLNNHKISDLMSSALRIDKEATITRPVIFEGPVTVNELSEVEFIDGFNEPTILNHVSERMSSLVSIADEPDSVSNDLEENSVQLRQVLEQRSTWLEYLRINRDLTGMNLGAHSRVNHVQMSKSDEILVTLHQNMDGQQHGLPEGCPCNTVTTIKLEDLSDRTKSSRMANTVVSEDKCINVYNVASPTKRSYTVTSETISSNTTCVTANDGATTIFLGDRKIGSLTMGHISDVGVFSQDDVDYLVLAQYFDKTTDSHSTMTRVMRVTSHGTLESVQDIETHGAKKIAVGQIDENWMLAVANSKSSKDESSCNAESAIYKWSQETSEFRLRRTIMTDGAFDVQFIITETSKEFYKQSFVVFAQQGNSASGEVLIFRHEQPEALFVLSQTIRPNWPVTGLGTWSMCRQSFIVTVVPQEGITFYENRFVEGFKEYYKAPIVGATDFSAFTVGDQHLFAIATSKGPILAEAVISGLCESDAA